MVMPTRPVPAGATLTELTLIGAFPQLAWMPRWGSTVRPQCPVEDSSWTWLQPLSLSCIFNIPSLFQEHSPRTTDPAPIEPASYSITRHESHAHTPDETAARPPLRPINLPPRLPPPSRPDPQQRDVICRDPSIPRQQHLLDPLHTDPSLCRHGRGSQLSM